MMILCVTGSRTWEDRDLLSSVLVSYLTRADDLVLHVGDARGADEMASQVAHGWGCQVVQHRAEWRALGKRAGMVRNKTMLDEARPDILIAFKQGLVSAGTDGCMDLARARNIPILLVQAIQDHPAQMELE